ncbi:hypothetical protein DFH11DRAFT_1618458, partial [Phellopilus nigrolimitatus]
MNGRAFTLNERMIHIVPATTETIKLAVPSSSRTASAPAPARTAENVLNTSGESFPNARNVTPATFSSSPSRSASVARLGQKKSEGLMPRVEVL